MTTKRTFRVVLAPKDRDANWTATTYVECQARRMAAGQAMRKLSLLPHETRVLRVEPA